MFKIVCQNCDKENSFHSMNNVPVECSFCFEQFDSSIAISESNEQIGEITGLTIIYQVTQQRLEVSILHKTILGRENFGADIFKEIFSLGKLVVSRKHCSIEFKDSNFYLLDEGSLNGTYYGVNKLNCKNSPHVIENNSIFYIGDEAFIAQINFQEEKIEPLNNEIEKKQEVVKSIKLYRCNESGCGYETQTSISVCPSCSTFNSLIPIYQ